MAGNREIKAAPCLMRTGFPPSSRFRKAASGAGNENQANLLGIFLDELKRVKTSKKV